jgi:hypothetical protein
LKFRLLLAILLLIPMPVLAVETQVDEPFDENGFTQSTISVTNWSLSNDTTTSYEINNTWAGDYGSTGYSINYNMNSVSNRMLQITFSENDITEIGFKVGAVNYEWHYNVFIKDSDGNSSNPDWVTYSITGQYQDFDESYTAPEGYTIWRIEMNFSDYVLVDDLYYVYDDGTTETNTTSSTTSSTTTSTTTTSTTTTSSTTTTTTIPPTEEELNYAETGIYETNSERKAREEREAEAARIKAAEDWERDKNFEETGIRELDSERREREAEEAAELERDQERSENKDKWDCYMTNAQIQRGDCEPYNQILKAEEEARIAEEKRIEEERIAEEERLAEEKRLEEERIAEEKRLEEERIAAELKAKEEAEASLEELDIDLPEDIVEEYVEVIKEVEEFIEDIVIEEEVFEIPEEIIIVLPEEPVEEVIEDELDKEIPGDDIIREEEVQAEDELTDNKEPEEVIEIIEEVVVEELETEQVIEVLEEIADVGVENLELASEDVLEVVAEVVEESINNVEELTEEQVEVVAEVLQVETEDVEIIAVTAKEDEVIQEAVDVFVEKVIENKDVEDYTFADVVTEIQFENFLENPIEVLVDFEDISFDKIGDDMTSDQKEKAQEVVVPVILTRIVSMTAFVFRRSL